MSADPNRTLIGDDEHGWGNDGVFNFEGGCYAKCIKLSNEAEPQIFAASNRFGAVLENVVLGEDTRVPDFDDGSKTENTRSAYPLEFIPNASRTGRAGQPKNVVMLAADAFGVLPRSQSSRRRRRCITSCPATRRRSPAPNAVSATSRSRNSPPASVRRSCRSIPPFTATCCAS